MSWLCNISQGRTWAKKYIETKLVQRERFYRKKGLPFGTA